MQPTDQPNPYDFLKDVQVAPDPSQKNQKRKKILIIAIVSAVILLITSLAVALTTSPEQTNIAQEEYKPGNIEVLRAAYSELQLEPENDNYTIDGCSEPDEEAGTEGLCYYTMGYYYDDTSYFTTVQAALESNAWQHVADESDDAYLSYTKDINAQKVCAVLSYGSLDDDDQRVSLVFNTDEATCQSV